MYDVFVEDGFVGEEDAEVEGGEEVEGSERVSEVFLEMCWRSVSNMYEFW